MKKGATVLDLGCGTGYLTKVLSEQVGPEGKVVAVDSDGERLKIAWEKHSADNIEYIQADDNTFPPGQYDLVFSTIVFTGSVIRMLFLSRFTKACTREATLHSQLPMVSIQFLRLGKKYLTSWQARTLLTGC